jgi:transposase
MCLRRIDMDRLQELVRLHRMKTGSREVARLLRMSPNTERQYRLALEAEGLLAGIPSELPELEVLKEAVTRRLPPTMPPQMTSSIEHWEPLVRDLAERGLRPRAVFDRLRLEHADFDGTYWAVRAAWRRWRRDRGVRAEDVVIPVETHAGEIGQVDFGYVGKLYDPAAGQLRKAWVFVMVLGHSRRMVVRLCFDQKLETWLRCHAEAFAELGGVVETIVPDNLRAAVVRAAFGVDGATALNRTYREFARHFGFKVDPAPIYSPEKKGKVESGVKYVKQSFFVGRGGADADEIRILLARWVSEIANARIHGTTYRRPAEVFEAEERAALRALPERAWEPVEWKEALVHRDSHIAFDKRLYSAPWRLIGKKLWVRATTTTVTVYAEDVRVATHSRRGRGPRSTQDAHLPPERAPWRHRSRAFWEERAGEIAPEVRDYIAEVFDADDVLSMLRTVQSIVTHLERFPRERAIAACARARFYGSHSYGAIKNILRQGLDLQPLPTVVAATAALPAPRFARSITELLHPPMEEHDELN